jgi:hypothetical protein
MALVGLFFLWFTGKDRGQVSVVEGREGKDGGRMSEVRRQEGQAAQSRKDFASKMAIASKEARETLYWLRLLAESGFFNGYSPLDDMYTEIRSIINIITRIVKTTTDRNQKPKT